MILYSYPADGYGIFWGGLVAIGVALGFITWAATLEALKSERALAAIELIEKNAEYAQQNAEGIRIALDQAHQALDQSLAVNTRISKLVTFEDGCTGEIHVSEKPAKCEVEIPEPNCNWSFEKEQTWCENNSPCKYDTASVVGIDTATSTCSYERCSYVCEPNIIGNLVERLK